MRTNSTRWFFIGSLLLGPPAPTFAATYQVPAEFPTIQAAIDASTDGDEIIVATGTYHENLSIGGKNITLRSDNPSDASTVLSTALDASHTGSVITFLETETVFGIDDIPHSSL